MSYVAQLKVLFSSIAAVLAWVVQILYARTRLKAKEAVIRGKDVVIESKDAKIELLVQQLDISRSLEAGVLLGRIRTQADQIKQLISEHEQKIKVLEDDLAQERSTKPASRDATAEARAAVLEEQLLEMQVQLFDASRRLDWIRSLEGIGSIGLSYTYDGRIPPLIGEPPVQLAMTGILPDEPAQPADLFGQVPSREG